MLTIVLSGPKVSTNQACTALVAAGLSVETADYDHGLTEHASGEDIREPQAFVTVQGDDIDHAHQTIRSLGWCLRLHFPTPEPTPPSAMEQMAEEIARLRAEVEALKVRQA